MSNLVTLKAVSNSILTASEFVQELTTLKAKDAKERSQAAKRRYAKKKQELRQLSLEASADWNRVLNRISNSILNQMLQSRWSQASITPGCLLGTYGIRPYSHKPHWGLLEEALRGENLLSNWLYGRYIDGKYTLKDFVKNEYKTGLFNDLIVDEGGRRGRVRKLRYYEVSNSQMATVNKKRNTILLAVIDELESILSASGYIVKNKVELTKWKNTKSTVHYVGYLNIIAQ